MMCKWIFCGMLTALVCPCLFATALDDYVAIPDPAYDWQHVSSDNTILTNAYTLDLRSQRWRDVSEVDPDQVEWKHWVNIVVPNLDWLLGATKDTALILISDGNSLDPAPPIDDRFRDLATGTRSIIVELTAVPNQPLYFADDVFSRSEDEIIAYSWDKFLNGGDPNWPAQLPMVKSVVACMDAVQEFIDQNTSKTVNHFVLTGGSKRGWTAWLTAAVDDRVTAAAPIVSDLLNMQRTFAHQWACYGFWAEALSPYEDLGIFDWFDAPRTEALLEIVDPYRYRNRQQLQIPKFLIMASGDDFFVSDSAQFYIHDLLGPTHMRIVPNATHYLNGPGIMESVFNSMVPYYDAFLDGDSPPSFDWTVEPDGSIYVETTTAPKTVNLWQITNPNTRDFRLVTTGDNWMSSPLADQGGGLYIGQVPQPPMGWTAYFVELTFAGRDLGGTVFDYTFTTEMVVLPEIRPFETDFSRDRQTDLADLAEFTEVWLTGNAYRDIWPRRGGDDIVSLSDLALFGLHWLE